MTGVSSTPHRHQGARSLGWLSIVTTVLLCTASVVNSQTLTQSDDYASWCVKSGGCWNEVWSVQWCCSNYNSAFCNYGQPYEVYTDAGNYYASKVAMSPTVAWNKVVTRLDFWIRVGYNWNGGTVSLYFNDDSGTPVLSGSFGTCSNNYCGCRDLSWTGTATTDYVNGLSGWKRSQNVIILSFSGWMYFTNTKFTYVLSDRQCQKGYYMDSTAQDCLPCAAGKYRDTTGGVGATSCSICPAGRYGSLQGETRATCQGDCDLGYYCACTAGCTSSTPSGYQCPRGKYGSSTGLQTATCSGPCEAGVYCPLGSVYGLKSQTPALCRAGNYGVSGGAYTDDSCAGPCAPGYLCDAPGFTSPTSQRCGDGQSSDAQRIAYYCPQGTAVRLPVSSGYIAQNKDNTIYTNFAQVQCPVGYYCNAGVQNPCPVGRYGGAQGLTNNDCTSACDAGYFCPAGSTGPRQEDCGGTGSATCIATPALCYCPSGTTQRLVAGTSGVYTIPTTVAEKNRQDVANCPAGVQCQNGVMLPTVAWANCANNVASLSIAENLPAGTQNVGTPITTNKPSGSTYRIASVTRANTDCVNPGFSVGGSTGQITVGNPIDFESCPFFTVQLEATDSIATITCAVTVIVQDKNDAPTFTNCNLARRVSEDAPQLTSIGDPVVAADPDKGQSQSYTIVSQTPDDSNIKISRCTGQITVGGPMNALIHNQYSLVVRVDDDGTPSMNAQCTVVVNLDAINHPPTFASVSLNLLENTAVGTLVTTLLAVDPENGALTYKLTKADVIDAFSVAQDGKVRVKQVGTSTTSPLDFESYRVYTLTVTATDNGGKTADATLQITLLDANDAPQLVVSGTFHVNEGDYANTATLVGSPFTSFDQDAVDAGTFTYTVTPTTYFDVNPSTGQLFVKGSSGTHVIFNYEAVTTYTISVTTKDGRGSTSAPVSVTIYIDDVNEQPYFIGAPFSFTVPENSLYGTAVGTVAGGDPDGGQTVSFSITGGTGQSYFSIEGGTGNIFVKALGLDYEQINTYQINVRIKDSWWSPLTADTTVNIAITNVDEPPTLNDVVLSVNENSAPGTTVGTFPANDPETGAAGLSFIIIDGNDGSTFAISNAGLVTVANNRLLDYEGSKRTFIMTVQVSDSGNHKSTAKLTVNTQNVNEAPVITSVAPLAIQELSAVGTLLVHVVASDPESNPITFSIVSASDPDGYWQISATGDVTVKKQLPDVGPTGTNQLLSITASDGTLTSAAMTISITVQDVNHPPVLTAQTRSVAESATLATQVGAPIAGTDSDNDPVSYAMITEGPFAIDPTSGQITVNGPLDYETKATYALTVQVSDYNVARKDSQGIPLPGLTSTGIVTINIIDVNEAPTMSAATVNVNENPATGLAIATLVGADPDAGQTAQLSYSILTNPSPFVMDGAVIRAYGYPAPSDNTVPSGYVLLASNMQLGGASVLSSVTTLVSGSFTKVLARYKSGYVTCDSPNWPGSGSSYKWQTCYNPSNNHAGCETGCYAFELLRNGQYVLEMGGWSTLPSSCTKPSTATGDILCDVTLTLAQGDKLTTTWYEPSHSTSTSDNAGTIVLDLWGQFKPSGETIDFEKKAAYSLTVQTMDPLGLTGTNTVTVNVNNVNEAPWFDPATKTVYIKEDATVGQLVTGLSVFDQDSGDASTFSILSGNAQGRFTIDASNQVVVAAALDYESVNSYTLSIQAKDKGNLVATFTLTIAIQDVNEAPSVTVPATATVAEMAAAGTSVFTVSATDPDAGNPGFVWSISMGNNYDAFQITPTGNGATAAITVKTSTALDYEDSAHNSFVLTIRVADSGKLYAEGTVRVTITDINEAPTFAAMTGSVKEMSPIDTPVLDLAAGTSDPDNGQTFTYAITTGDSAGMFKISGSKILMAVTTLDYESRQMFGFQYVLGVKVTDSGSPALSATATITIQVLDVNEPPIIVNGARSVPENSAARTLVGDPISAIEPDINQLLKYSIDGGDPTGIFKINACSGQIEVVNPVLDYEGPNPTYTLTISATDDGSPRLTSSATFVITITDVNEAPVVQTASLTVPENSAMNTPIGTPILATDPDNDKVANTQTLRFSIVAGNTGDLFAINANTGQLTVYKALLDFESPLNSYRITVQATDNHPTSPLSGVNDVFIQVTDVNEAPIFVAQTIAVDENSAPGTQVLPRLACSDPDVYRSTSLTMTQTSTGTAFSVASNGLTTVVTQSVLDYETTPSLSFIAKCCDNDASPLCTSATITVQVRDVNEAPTLAPSTVHVQENVAVGTAVGAAIRGADVDAGQTLTYRIVTQPTAGLFRIDGVSGQIEVATAALDYESRNSYALTVEVKDSGSPSLTATATITVLIDDVNEPPVLSALQVSRVVSELAAVGVTIGSPVTAIDVDANDAVTFSITAGNTNNLFAIDGTTGQLRLAVAALDFETTASYTLTVTATDKGGLKANGNVVITVSDQNEAPWFLQANFPIAAAENSVTASAIGKAQAKDQDAADVGALRFSLTTDNSAGRFSVDAADGTIRVARSLVQTAGTTFVLGLTVVDVAGLSATCTVSITVTNANWPPVMADAQRTVAENTASGVAIGAPLVATDANTDQVLTYSIQDGSFNWNSVVQINPSTGQLSCKSTPFDYELMNKYTLTIQVKDNGAPSLSTTATVTLFVTDVNEVPVVQPAVLSIVENSSPADIVDFVFAIDQDSYDAGKLTFAIVSGNINDAFAIASSGLLFVKKPILNYEALPKYSLGITAKDLGGLVSTPVIITVTLIDVNDPPVFSSTSYSRSVPENSAVGTLVGTAVTATDEDVGQKLTYTITSGNTNGAFAVSSTGQITVASMAALNYEVQTSFTLTLQVLDDGANPVPAVTTVMVTVQDVNEAPTFPAASTTRSVSENSAVGTLVSGGVVVASDVDNNQFLSYAIVGGSDIFRIDTSTGQLSVIAAVLDYETRNQYVIQVTATDSGTPQLAATISVTINIVDVNEVPTFLPATVSVPENSAAGTLVGSPVLGSDVDAGQTLSYSIVSSDLSLTAFSIVASTGQIKVGTASLDYESRDTYAVVVRATDSGSPALYAQATVTVKVTDVNEAPVINDAIRNVDENSAVGMVVGAALPATDPDRDQMLLFTITEGNSAAMFKIDPCSGQLMVAKNTLNYESQNIYVLTVTVYDNGVPSLSDTAVITININDVNEPPALADATLSVDENSPVKTFIGAKLVGTDPDFGQAAKLKYAIVDGNKDSIFGVNATSGQVYVARAVLDYESTNQYALTVSVTDNGEPILSSTAKVTIVINDVNEAPVFVSTTRSVPENVASGTLVGTPVTGADPDRGAVVSYRIISGGAKFGVYPTTGQLWVTVASLDYETQNSYSVTVGCSDGLLETSAVITIQIEDVNEPPAIADQTRYINENTPVNTPAGAPIVATDPDTSPPERLLFSITSGDNATIWAIDAYTGQISLRAGSLNYEDAWSPSQFHAGKYYLQVAVQDKLAVKRTATVTIQVQNVNDAPTLAANQVVTISENVPAGTAAAGKVVAEDEDAGDHISYSISGGTGNALFSIHKTSGVVTFVGTILDYETTPTLTLVVSAQDTSNATVSATVTVAVQNVNEAPVLLAQTRAIAEHQPFGTLVGSPVAASDVDAGDKLAFSIVSGNSEGQFSIVAATGQLTLAKDKALNYNGGTTSYALGVKVVDLAGLSATATITINVLDVNEPPTIATVNPTFTVNENSPVGTTLGVLRATDPEGTAVTWSILNDNKIFAVAPTTGVLTVNKDVLNYESDSTYLLTLQAMDSSADHMTSTTTVAVSVLDVNEVPVMLAQSRSVPENSAVGTLIGVPLVAADQDAGANGILDYSIASGNSLGLFNINTNTGQLSVAKADLDFEKVPSYTITVRAQDRGNPPLNVVATITVVILDVNDAPTLQNFAFTVPENRAQSEVVGQPIQAFDQDRLDTLAYRITGANCWSTSVPSSRNVYNVITLQKVSGGTVSGTFKAMGADGVLLGLFTSTQSSVDMYEIQLSPTAVTIRRGAQASTALVTTAASGILSAVEYRTFWFSVAGKVISVGTGPVVGAAGSTLATVTDAGTALTLAYVGVAHATTDVVTIPAVCFGLPAGQASATDLFDLKPATGQLSMLRPGLDYETVREYSFEVTVTDGGGLTAAGIVRVSVSDLNEAPWFYDDCAAVAYIGCFTIPENSAVGTTVMSSSPRPNGVGGGDPDTVAQQTVAFAMLDVGNLNRAFSIHPTTGVISVATAGVLNFESANNVYVLTVTITDSAAVPITTTAQVQVSLTDVNEVPVIADTIRYVRESTGAVNIDDHASVNGTLVGTPIVATDVDSPAQPFGKLTYSIVSGNDVGIFVITRAGQISVYKPLLNFEDPTRSKFVLGVRATDGGGLYATASVTVMVTDVNEQPVIASAVRQVPENSLVGTLVGLPLPASDVDIGQFLTYSIIASDGAGIFKISPCSGQLEVSSAVLDFETKPTYTLTVQVLDDGIDPPRLSAAAQITVQLQNVNEQPNLDDTQRWIDENSRLNTPVGAPMVGTDPDANTILSYTITSGNDLGYFGIDSVTGQIYCAIDKALDFESRPIYNLVVRATDNGVPPLFDDARVTVNINDLNEAPVFTAGVRAVEENSKVGTLVGLPLSAVDPEVSAGRQKLSWRITGGNAGGVFSLDPSSGQLTVASAVLDYETTPTYTLRINVTDNGVPMLSTAADITVQLVDINEPPTIEDAVRSVAENSPSGFLVGAPIPASDPERLPLLFTIISGNDAQVFTIDNVGQLRIDKPARLDFESLSPPQFVLQVMVTDAGTNGKNRLTDFGIVTINVLNVNEPPVMGTYTRSVKENSPVGTLVGDPVTATDVDAGDTATLVYSLQLPANAYTADNKPFFAVSPTTGQISVATAALDFESVSSFGVTVTATDVGGLSNSAVTTINLLNVNEPPSVVAPGQFSVHEHSKVGQIACTDPPAVACAMVGTDPDAGDRLTWAITASWSCSSDNTCTPEAGVFVIDPQGALLVKNNRTATFRSPNYYKLTVQVTDSGGFTGSATALISIAVLNLSPEFRPVPLHVNENSAVGTIVTGTVLAVDADQDVQGRYQTIAYTINPPTSLFTIQAIAGGTGGAAQLVVNSATLNHEAVPVYLVTISAVDNGTPPRGATATFQVFIDDVNEAPTIAAATRSVPENSAVGTAVGDPVVGSDVDVGDTQTYSIAPATPNDVQPFSIDSATGQLRVAQAILNYEVRKSYPVLVTVVDKGGLRATAAVTINVDNVNELPVIVAQTFSLAENKPRDTFVGKVLASDPDAAAITTVLTYTLSAVDAYGDGVFTIGHDTGNIQVLSPVIDFEDHEVYRLQVTVTDDGPGDKLSATATITINVIDVNDLQLTGFTLERNSFTPQTVAFGTPGGTWVRLLGSNMGKKDANAAKPNIVATYQSIVNGQAAGPVYSATSCLIVSANNAIECLSAAGVGSNLVWSLTVGRWNCTSKDPVSGVAVTTSYKVPTINTALNADALPTAGGSTFMLSGNDFGPASSKVVVQYRTAGRQYVASNCAVMDHNVIQCKSVPGVGSALQFTVTVPTTAAAQTSPLTSTSASYATPAITSVAAATGRSLTSLVTAGGDVITLTGTDFGPVGFTGAVAAAYGLTSTTPMRLFAAASCQVKVAHTQMLCITSPGVGSSHAWRVSVGGILSGWSATTTSYAAPVVTSLGGVGFINANTEGGQSLVLTGTNFGPIMSPDLANSVGLYGPPVVTYGRATAAGYSGVNCSVTAAHTQITCLTSPGTGKDHSIKVAVGTQASPVLAAHMSYAAPVVVAFSGAGAQNAITPGGQEVFIEGRQFGYANAMIQQVTYGEDGRMFSASGTCTIVTPHRMLRCITAEGAGAGLKWVIVVDGQESGAPTTYYDHPTILSVSGPGATAASTNGGQDVVITGKNFGPSTRPTFLESVTYGPTAAEYQPLKSCRVTSHTQITCKSVPGVGQGHTWAVKVKGQGSPAAPTVTSSYEKPVIVSISTNHGPTIGGTEVVVTGTGFGLVTLLETKTSGLNLKFGNVVIPSTDLRNFRYISSLGTPFTNASYVKPDTQHQFTFYVPEALDFGKERDVVVQVIGVDNVIVSSAPVTFSYDDPVIIGVYPLVDRSTNTQMLDIEGVNFGLISDVIVEVNGVPQKLLGCTHEPTHAYIHCPFNGVSGVAHVERGTQVSNSVAFLRRAAQIANLASQDMPSQLKFFDTAGGETLTVAGYDFPEDVNQVNITVGGRVCKVNGAMSKTSTPAGDLFTVTCTVPQGQGTDVPVIVTSFGQRSPSAPVNYEAPCILSVSPVTAPTSGRDDSNANVKVTLSGRNFGMTGQAALMHKANGDVHAPLTCTWTHTQAVCDLPEGAGSNMYFTIFMPPDINDDPRGQYRHQAAVADYNSRVPASDRITFLPQYGDVNGNVVHFSYDVPIVTAVDVPAYAHTRGGYTITLHGKNFGYDQSDVRVMVGYATAGRLLGTTTTADLECKVTGRNHRAINCTMPAGEGSHLQFKVTVDGLINAPNPVTTFSYHLPTLTSVSPSHADTQAIDSTGRPLNLTLTGTNFGRSGHVWLQRDPDDTLKEAQELHVLEWTHERIVAQLVPDQGQKRRVVVETGTQTSAETVLFSYNRPYLNSTAPDTSSFSFKADRFPTKGGYKVTLYGSSFGVRDLTMSLAGKRLDLVPNSQSHTQVAFIMPAGIGIKLPLLMAVGSQQSTPLLLSYDPPRIDYVRPFPANSEGDQLQMFGANFGAPGLTTGLTILLDGLNCTNAVVIKGAKGDNDYLQCSLQRSLVGFKNVTIDVADQVRKYIDTNLLRTRCPEGKYGQSGEHCLDCPIGAMCKGTAHPKWPNMEAEPISIGGWWLKNVTDELSLCPPERLTTRLHLYDPTLKEFVLQPHCPYALPCEPQTACNGSNICNTGYTGDRCSLCAPRYYRRTGECVECPDNPLLLVLGFLAAAIVLCVAGYFLNKKSVNLAFISIGVDYFQVLAMFANSKIKWPYYIKYMFTLMSVFNFNLEITAPECSIPELGYKLKWTFIEVLPLAAGSIFLIMHLTYYFKKRCIQGRKKHLNSHVSALIGTFLVLFYYMYLYLTRTSLDVFNCSPTDPPDGHEYLQVVFERCDEPGGIHNTLLMFAVLSFIVYTLGYPTLVAWILYRNRLLVMEDQLLRAKGIGTTRLDNPNAYDMRKRFHKIYYHFKPDNWYWVLVIIARKLGIATTALMFNKTPAFQLSMALLVMFAAYAAQVRCSPYMSPSEYSEVLRLHDVAAKDPTSAHSALAKTLAHIQDRGRKQLKKFSWNAGASDAARAAANFFWSYNTVEAVLLACAVLVNLAGVMFESGRFDSDYYQTQEDVITTCTMLIIGASLVYFFTVFLSEIYTTVKKKPEPKEGKDGEKKKSARATAFVGQDGASPDAGPTSDGEAIVSSGGLNPLFLNKQANVNAEELFNRRDVPNSHTWESIRTKYQEVSNELSEMKKKVQLMEALGPAAGSEGSTGGSGRTLNQPNRIQFQPRRAGATAVSRGSGRRQAPGARAKAL